MKPTNRGFTLIEILLSMSVLVVGLVGILALFPVGLDATRKAIEDTTAAMIAESVYASFRASVQRISPGEKLAFFYDGIDKTGNANQYPKPSGLGFKNSVMYGKTFGIPDFTPNDSASPTDGTPISIYYDTTKLNYKCTAESNRCFLGRNKGFAYDVAVPASDGGQLAQYSFNIQISYPDTNPKNLYDIAIRVYRNNKLIKRFNTQVMIPTSDD